MGKFHSTLVFHPANTGWKNGWQICYSEIFRVVRFVTRFYTWQILWFHAKLVKISHISCFYPANLGEKTRWQIYNTKYFMPMDLSRVFTPDKSCDFAQFLWENITHLPFSILQGCTGIYINRYVYNLRRRRKIGVKNRYIYIENHRVLYIILRIIKN